MHPILLFSLSATAAAAAGVAMLAAWPALAQRASGLLEAAAGGALLVMGALYLAPEALHLYPGAWALILVGAALGFGLQRAASLLAGGRAAALSLLAGLGLHSLLDGAAFAISLTADPIFGLGSAAGLVMHDAPKALFAYVLLHRAGLRVGGAVIGAMFTAAGLSALGAVAAAPVADALPLRALGGLTGLASGLLIYSGLACLVTLRERPVWLKAAAAGTAALAIAWVGQLGHSHVEAGIAPAPPSVTF